MKSMKYPFISNWITYKRIPEQHAYYVRNYILDIESIVPAEMMRFAKKLDGKTNPYSIGGKRSRAEIRDLLDELEEAGVIRMDHGYISDGDGHFMWTLVILRNTKFKRIMAKIFNFLLMVSFLPILIWGIYVYRETDAVSYSDFRAFETFVYDHTALCVWGLIIISVILGAVLHELSHSNACRAYGGLVFEYGAMVSFLPGLYTLIDYSRVKSRLKKVQILAAGIESNLLLAGCFLLLSGLFPFMKPLVTVGAFINVTMVLINMMAIEGTDGMRMLLLLIGVDSEDIEEIKRMTRGRRKRKMLKKGGYNGYVKLTACYMIIWLQKVYPILIILDVIVIIGAII